MNMMDGMLEAVNKSIDELIKPNAPRKNTIKDNMDELCDILEEEILKADSTDDEKRAMLKRLRTFCNTETNIMLVGATGCGKSSTINALFSVNENNKGDDNTEENDNKSIFAEIAKVGSKSDPETKDIEKYKIGNLILWDTPGLGDGTQTDEHHKDVITELLREETDGKALIDLVLVILDGSTRDLGTSYKLLNEVIIPELKNEKNRILVALNQADIAMKTGRHWDYVNNEPDDTLINYLEDKVESIKHRIKQDSDLDIEPIYYCAGYKEENGDVVNPYNLSKLLYYIMESLPAQKRVAVMEGINTDSDNYKYSEDDEFNEKIKDSFINCIDYIGEGVDNGAEIGGRILGTPGKYIGAIVGGIIGCVREFLDEIFM